MEEFTGSSESVITVHTPEALKKWIQFVSVRASEVASKSASIGSSSKQEEFTKEIQNQVADAADWDSFDDEEW